MTTAQISSKKYGIVYADPPWPGRGDCPNGGRKTLFPLMSHEDIAALPVTNIVLPTAFLFMWVIGRSLPWAFWIMKSWGFRYVSIAFVWVKTNKAGTGYVHGMGFYTRQCAELCLLGVRGKPHMPQMRSQTRRTDWRAVPQVVAEPRGPFAKKPDCVRERILRVCGDLPRIELFARQRTPGWDVWGNEA